MHPSQGSKASWFWQVRQWSETLPDMRDIHKMGRPLVPVLWLSSENKAKEPEVQGEAEGQSPD